MTHIEVLDESAALPGCDYCCRLACIEIDRTERMCLNCATESLIILNRALKEVYHRKSCFETPSEPMAQEAP
ncbi:MAG: hypothetical protein V3R83_09815 [Gammaproteobacteria bacterium]